MEINNKKIRIALVGQPNSGKSTLFNSVAGYKAIASNFPGTTVECFSSKVNFLGKSFYLIDFPGIYSLIGCSGEEVEAIKNLIRIQPDVIVNVIDATTLGRSLELTIELLELEIPCVLCLNMMDEAHHKGITINVKNLEDQLQIPAIPTIATHGQGVKELFEVALGCVGAKQERKPLLFSKDVEEIISRLEKQIISHNHELINLTKRFTAIKILERDEALEKEILKVQPELKEKIEALRKELELTHGRPSDVVLSSERHALAFNIFEKSASVTSNTRKGAREIVDNYILHPYLGYLFLAIILGSLFYFIFGLGKLIEKPLIGVYEHVNYFIEGILKIDSLYKKILTGFVGGFFGGAGVVFPYLTPFLIALSILEDVGYLPRVAFLMDALMHRIGLHGIAVIPMVLGYGCSVPAVMSLKVMTNKWEKFHVAFLINLVPCSARTTIILALIGFFMGPFYALALYIIDIFIVAATGKVISKIHPEVEPGFILEIPPYRVPKISTIAGKVWLRLREFMIVAWPLLIAGNILLGILDYFKISRYINIIISPLVEGILGLPEKVGIPLIFGVLRKELSIVMLIDALGTSNFKSVLSTSQMLTFTVFTIYYIPCLATFLMLWSVIGLKMAGIIAALTFIIATFLGLLTRIITGILF